MKGWKTALLVLLCLCLAGVLLLRIRSGQAAPEPRATAVPTAAPTPAAEPTAAPTPSPAPSETPTPSPAPTAFVKPKGYTEESYRLVSDMCYAYADRQEAAVDIISDDLARLSALDPALGELWGKLMRLWSSVNTELDVNDGLLPDGLPEDDSLCIVVLGFQLEADGSMAPELVGRCETALACAEKYPRALIAVTGGGTAWQNPAATEAGVMAAWLTKHGVSPERILTEDASMTTADNAVFTCRLLRERCPQVRSLAVVSSDYHVPLGVLLFQARACVDEYETGALPFSVVSNAAYHTDGRSRPDSPMMQKNWLWSVTDPHY